MKSNIKNENDSEILFNLIPDEPLDADKKSEIKFGHELISKTLKQIINRANTPFSIGLYGGWGSGKTTIVDLLKDDLREDKKIKVVYIDLWKFENDSLRRQIILKTAEELSLCKYISLKEKIYFSISENKQKITFNWKKIIVSCLIFLVKIGSVTLLANIFIKNLLTSLLSAITSNFVIQGIADGFKQFDKSLFLNDVVITRDRLSEPEEFECEFKKIIGGSSKKKIVFILDNLDRMSSEKAVEVLSTVKTFLEIKKCIFLIPCDEDAIKKHISSIYIANNSKKGSNKYADEFLRKFFNTTIRIPKFENTELNEYTQNLLKKTNLPELKIENSNLLWLINFTFRNNPREIKQFINTLVSTIVLINSRIKEGLIADKDILKENLPFFAKILIIKQKFPKMYKKLEDEIVNYTTDWKDTQELYENKGKTLRRDKKTVCESIQFIEKTSLILPYSNDLSFFFTYAQSTNELRLPGWNSFLKAVIDRDILTAETIVRKFIKSGDLNKFDTFSQQYLSENRMNQNAYWFISSCINFFSKIKQIYVPNMAIEFVISLQFILENLEDEEIFPIKKTIKLLKNQVQIGQNEKLAKSYVNILSKRKNNLYPSNHAMNIIYTVLKYPNYFKKCKDDFCEVINSSYNNPQYANLIFSTNKKSEFITEEFIDNFLEKIDETTINDISELEAITSSLIKIEFNNNYVLLKKAAEKIKEITRIETIKQPEEKRDIVVKLIKSFYKSHITWANGLDSDFKKDNIDYLSSQLIKWFGECQSWKEKLSMFRTALILLEVSNESDSLKQNLITPFIKTAPYDDVFSKIRDTETKLVVSDYIEALKTNTSQNYDTFKNIYSYLDVNTAEEILVRMLDINIDNALLSIEEIFKYKISERTKEILNKLYGFISNLNQEQKDKIFNISHKLKCGDDVEIVNKFYDELLKLKTAINVKKYLSKPKLFSPPQIKELLTPSP